MLRFSDYDGRTCADMITTGMALVDNAVEELLAPIARKMLAALLLGGTTLTYTHAAEPTRPHWYPLKWVVGSLDGQTQQRIALLVKASINGKPCDLQLDTGMNNAIRWHVDDGRPSAGEEVKVAVAGLVREVVAPKDTLQVLGSNNSCSANGPIGSVGNAFFEQGTLTLDLRNDRFAYTPRPLLSKSVRAQPFFYPRWGSEGGHIVVEIGASGQTDGYAMLDTGAASAGLNVLDAASWSLLTGDARLDANPRVRKFEVSSWGRRHSCVEMKSGRALRLNSYKLEDPLISYCPELGFKAPIALMGILGLRSLGGQVLTLDYRSRRWSLSAN